MKYVTNKKYINMIKEVKEITLEIKDRWKEEMPDFWKKVLKYSVTLGTSAVAIIGADKLFDLQAYGVPTVIFTICGYVIVACAAFGLSAKITKQ